MKHELLLKTAVLGTVAAATALPLVAQAQSSVQLGGRMKLGVDNVQYSGGTAPKTHATRVTDNSSMWFVKGTEDLGGGTQAFFHIENTISGDTGAMGSPRFHAVGLSNPAWGRVLAGVWSTYFASDSALSPASIVDGLPYAAGTLNVLGSIGKRNQYFAGGFLPNTLRYDSPRWGGFSFNASYILDAEAPNKASNHSYNINPNFVVGPWTLYGNYLRRSNQAGTANNWDTSYDQNALRVGAGYAAQNGFRAAVLVDRNEVKGTAVAGGKMNRTAWALPVSYRTGQHLFSAAYGQALSYKTGGAKANDTGAKMFSVGYEYFLSKRTSLAASFATVKNDRNAGYDFWHPNDILSAVSAGNSGFRSRYTYVGVKHTF